MFALVGALMEFKIVQKNTLETKVKVQCKGCGFLVKIFCFASESAKMAIKN